jgi:hypothetical protein
MRVRQGNLIVLRLPGVAKNERPLMRHFLRDGVDRRFSISKELRYWPELR